MEVLARHYEMDQEILLTQWQNFIDIVSSYEQKDRNLPGLLKLFFGVEHSNKGLNAQFPLLGKLLSAANVMPLSTAGVERVFSQLKLIKTDHRCSLSSSTLQHLLSVKLNCSKDLFNKLSCKVVKKFFHVKSRRLVSVVDKK